MSNEFNNTRSFYPYNNDDMLFRIYGKLNKN